MNQQLIRISNIQSGSAKKRIGSKWINKFGLFAATLQLAELLENNSVNNTGNFVVPSSENTTEGTQTNNEARVPPPVMDGENLDAPVTSRQLLQLLADFEERMTKKCHVK